MYASRPEYVLNITMSQFSNPGMHPWARVAGVRMAGVRMAGVRMAGVRMAGADCVISTKEGL
jgi:hypothetical protein